MKKMCEYCKLFNKGDVDIITHNKKITPFISLRLVKDGLEVRGLKAKYCTECGEPLTEPKPLTLEELKERIGKPTYIIDDEEPSNNGWTIWGEYHVENWLDVPGNGECCSTIWRAYDREP